MRKKITSSEGEKKEFFFFRNENKREKFRKGGEIKTKQKRNPQEINSLNENRC